MCGRYTLVKLEQFIELAPWIAPPEHLPQPRYNIAPTQAVAVVRNTPQPKVELVRWGLVPSWAGDLTIGNRLINARAETLATKPAFRTALARRRCIVPADGFYEWRLGPKGKKYPMYIRMKNGQPLAFAGLWDTWQSPETVEPVLSCTIITTPPNSLLEKIHDRMPAILHAPDYRRWLDPAEQSAAAMEALLGPYPAEELEAVSVGTIVNHAAHDAPDCLAPVEEGLFGAPG